MKKIYAYLMMAFAISFVFVSCSKDDDVPVHPMSGIYSLASYETVNEPKANYPVSSPLYAEIDIPGDQFIVNANGVLRMMGEALLPQVLNTITLDNDGNVCASYIENPTIKSDKLQMWAMGPMMLGADFPPASEVSALAATGGFVDSKKGLASWSEQGGIFTLKLNIENIVAESVEGDASGLMTIINSVLKMKPAEVKGLLAGLLGEDIMRLNDATISQLQQWALNGIPMTAVHEGANVQIFLQKKDFDSLFTERESGKVDDFWGSPIMECDASLLFTLLNKAGFIPEEAAMAGSMITIFQQNWSKIEKFDLGLSLVKKN